MTKSKRMKKIPDIKFCGQTILCGADVAFAMNVHRVMQNDLVKKIIGVLENGSSLPVYSIEQLTGKSQSDISQRLALMRKIGIVKAEKQGKYVFYSIDKDRFDAVIEFTTRVPFETVRALDHAKRLQILQFLIDNQESSVSTVFIKTRLEQSVASTHLKDLRKAKVVERCRSGKFQLYSAVIPAIERVQKAIVELKDKIHAVR